MKNEKGMSFLMLVIIIVVIIALIGVIIFFTLKGYKQEEFESTRTDMLKIEGRIKVLSESATAKKDETLKKGTKLSELEENELIKEVIEKGIVSKEEENYSEYYSLSKENLEEIGLNSIEISNGNSVIVNYKTHEVIYTEGIKIKDKEYFKLSELNRIKEESEIALNEQAAEKEKQTEQENSEQTENIQQTEEQPAQEQPTQEQETQPQQTEEQET